MTLTRRNLLLALVLGAVALSALVLVISTSNARGAGCTKTWKGGSGSWETASDWTPEGAPASTDDVCITASGAYTVTLNSNTTIASLDLGATVAGGTQTLDMEPPVRLEASAGGTIDEHGALTLEGNDAGSTTLLSAGTGTLTNAGTLALGVGAPTTSNMDLVGNVTNTGTIEVNTNSSYSGPGSGKTLDNEGPLKLANAVTLEDDDDTVIDGSGGAIEAEGSGKLETSDDFSVYEQGDGTTNGTEPVVVDSGSLDYTGTGASTIFVPASVALEGNIAAGQSLTALGSTHVTAAEGFTNAGTITLEGTSAGGATLKVSSGTLTNSGTISTQASGASAREPEIAGNVTNTGTVNIGMNSVYSGGTLDDRGPLRIANATTFENDDATVFDDAGGKIEATGTGRLSITLDDGLYDQGNGTTSGTEPVIVESDLLEYTGTGHSTVVVQDSGPSFKGSLAEGQSLTVLGSSSITAPASFTNAGTITLDATGGSPNLKLSAGTLTNSGTLTTEASGVSPGEPEIVGDLTNTGTVNVDVNTDFHSFAGALFDNRGAVDIANGVTLDDEQSFIDDTGGSIDAEGNGQLLTSSGDGVYDQGEGTTSGSEPVVMERAALDYTGKGQSTIVVVGNLDIQGSLSEGQSLTVRGNASVRATEGFTNAGTITIDGTGGLASVRLSTGTLTNSGTLTTEASGGSSEEPLVVGALTNTGTLNVQTSSSFEALVNSKTLTVAEGQTAQASSFTQTAGTTTLAGNSNATTLDVSSAKIEGGVLAGDGKIKGNLVNGGRVAPGTTTPGTISVTGSYTQEPGGVLAIDVAEGGADALAVTGTATLAGTLAVTTTGFTPTTGHTYTPITDSSQTGEFATLTGLSSGPYEIKYNPANVELIALASAPPTISIGNVTMRNPDSGNEPAKFTVTLSKASSTQVSVHYATTDGIARAPGDYEAASGTLTFAPGETHATIEVTVHGTSEPTADRTFFVELSNPTGATISQAQGAATVQNDHIALTSVTPAEGGQGGTATITLIGAGFSGTPTVTLLRAGQPEIVATNVTPDATGQAMTATFDLSAATIGAYEVVASLPVFAKSAALPEAFTVGEAEPANVTDELIGFPTVSTGEPWTGQLVYTNTGTVDAHNAILEVGGFQSGAHVTVSGPNVTGSVEEDNGISHTVQVYVSLIPAESTNVALVTFTPVGDNGSEYALQPSTFVSSDESFAQGASEPSVTATNVVGSETATSVQGAIHLESVNNKTTAGNVAYDIETQESSLPGGGSIPQPSVTETALPNGEERYELQATLPPEAQGPPPYSPTSLLSPGNSRPAIPPDASRSNPKVKAFRGAGGIASPLSRNPGKRRAASLAVARPDASPSSVLDEIKARYEAANGVIEKLESAGRPERGDRSREPEERRAAADQRMPALARRDRGL